MDTHPRSRSKGFRRERRVIRVALPALAGVAGFLLLACSPPDETLAISGPTTSSSTIIDLPAGPVSASAMIVERRLRAAGVRITAIDHQSGLITARSRSNQFVDCGQVYQVVDGRTREYAGNAPRIALADSSVPGGSVIRQLNAETSAGIGITQGVTNTIVVRQEHRVRIEILSADGRQVLSSETREFTDRGFARFNDGTVCRSSNAMSEALL